MKIFNLRFLSITIALFFKLALNSSAVAQSKNFVTADKIYEPTIKTALLLPSQGSKSDFLQSPVVELSQETPLVLSFDDLKDEVESYYIKIIHCNSNWTISSLMPIQYLYDYNEFFISSRNTSINTKIPYIHYTIALPRVKISGNYVVKVYRDYNEEDIVLSKRFMVYENAVFINANVRQAQKVSERNQSQQVDFSIAYPDYSIINPSDNFKVCIRQNSRWDNMIGYLPPLFVKEGQTLLEYNYFNMENGFKGGNEFTAFDFSSIITYKLNINKIINKPDSTEIILLEDKPRATEPYSTIEDIDGKFFIDHYETGDSEVSTPDYAMVNFVLNCAPVDGKIYVIGSLNDWNPDNSFQMVYNKDIKKYVCRVLLKQGFYNYRYLLVNSQFPKGNDVFFCGSHSNTQNNYEILAYYRPPGERADYLIGYKKINFMARR